MDGATVAVLERLRGQGVDAYVRDGRLFLHPTKLVTDAMVAELRPHKGVILAEYQQTMAPCLALQIKDQQWLAEHEHEHLARADLEGPFVAEMMGWCVLDDILRTRFGFTGCIHGEDGQCSPYRLVICGHCYELEVKRGQDNGL